MFRVLLKNGKVGYRPSETELGKMVYDSQGFCTACGEVHDNVEPDTERDCCDSCEELAVFGAENLALRGWVKPDNYVERANLPTT